MHKYISSLVVMIGVSVIMAYAFDRQDEFSLALLVGVVVALYAFVSWNYSRWAYRASEEELDELGYRMQMSFTRDWLSALMMLFWPIATVRLLLTDPEVAKKAFLIGLVFLGVLAGVFYVLRV